MRNFVKILGGSLLFALFITASLLAAPVQVRSDVRAFSENGFRPYDDYFELTVSDGGHKLVRNGNTIHAVFVDIRDNGSNYTSNLVYARSTNNGQSWDQRVIDTITGDNNFIYIWHPSIAVTGNNLYIVYAKSSANNAAVRYLMLVRDTDGAQLLNGNVSSSVIDSAIDIFNTSGVSGWFNHTDVVVDHENYVYVAATFGITGIPRNVKFYRSTAPGSTSFIKSIAVPAGSAVAAYTPALSVDNSGNVYLAYEEIQFDAKSEIKLYKLPKNAGAFDGTYTKTITSNFKVKQVNLVNDSAGNLHMTYAVRNSSAATAPMFLAYRMYNFSGILQPGSSENLLSAREIYSPQIGISAVDPRVAVIQYVSSNYYAVGATYAINQIHKTSPTTWSVSRIWKMSIDNSIAPGAVFPHMAKTIYNDKPDLLWYHQNDANPNSGTVYFHYDPPDKISPWQPDTPSLVWVNQNIEQSRNTMNNEIVSASVAGLPSSAVGLQIYYDWTGDRLSPGDTSWRNATSGTTDIDSKTGVADRQIVTVSAQLRDTASPPNVSEWSQIASIYIADRTPPTGDFTITANPVYTAPDGQRYINTSNATLLLVNIIDPMPGASGISGNIYVNNDSFAPTILASANSVQWNLTSGDGLKTVYARFHDVSTNYTNPNKQATINVDLTSPYWSGGATPTPDTIVSSNERNTYHVTWNRATDPVVSGVASGLAGYYVYVVNPSGVTSSTTLITSQSYDLYCTRTGTYNVYVSPVDNVGNHDNLVHILEYNYIGRPIYGDVYINNTPNYVVRTKYTNTLNVDLLFEYYPAEPDTVNVTSVSWNNENPSNFPNNFSLAGKPSMQTLYNWSLVPGGEGYRYVYAIYNGTHTLMGSVTSSVYVDTIIYDTTSPTASSTSIVEGWTSVNNREVFTWAPVTDPLPYGVTVNSGIGGYNVAWDTNASAIPSTYNYQTYGSFDPPVCPTTGIYYLHVQAVDRAGNTGPWTIVLTYKYDGIAPTGTLSAPASSSTRAIQLILSASDLPTIANGMVSAGQPVPWNNAAYQINETGILGNDWQPYTPGNINYTLTSPGNGPKIVYVWYRDNAGNVSVRTNSNPIDLNEPSGGNFDGSIKINGDSEYTNDRNVTLNLTYSEDDMQCLIWNEGESSANAKWQYLPDGGSHNVPWELTPGDGDKTVNVIYKDKDGNIYGPYQDHIILDTTPPYERTVSGGIVINNGDQYTTTRNVNLTLDAVGADYMRFWNDGSTEPAGDTGWVTYNAGYPWILNSPYGTRTVSVRFKDKAGNTSVVYFDTIEYVDPATVTHVTPSIAIKGGATHTNTTLNYINIFAPGAEEMRFANGDAFAATTAWSAWGAFDIVTRDWSLIPPSGEGTKNVWAEFRYADGTTIVVRDDIIFDITPPTGDPTNPPPGGGTWDGKAWISINDGAVYAPSQLVDLSLSAMDMYGHVDMLISNYPDFSDALGWEPYRPTRDWTLTAGDGPKTVYVYFRDEAGNIILATDTIELASSSFYFRWIEPDGYNDVASDNFTVSWEDAYPGDPNAQIYLYFNTNKDAPPNFVTQILTPNAIPVRDQVNGVIWDVSGLPTGKYYPYAIMTGVNGDIRVYSKYPVYIIHGDGNTWPTKDSGTDPDLPPGTGPGSLPEDPPAILVLTPTLPGELPNNGVYTIQYQYTYTGSDPTIISLYYDTSNDPKSTTRVLITTNIEVDPLRNNVIDIYNWAVAGIPDGDYYIYAEIKNSQYTRGDYSTGTVLITDSGHKPGNGGTGEPIWSFPNPFSPITHGEEANIAFTVDEDGWVRIFIYNVRGERIWQTHTYGYANDNGVKNCVRWDGRNARGQTAGNGIYILFLTDEKHKVLGRGRMTLLD